MGKSKYHCSVSRADDIPLTGMDVPPCCPQEGATVTTDDLQQDDPTCIRIHFENVVYNMYIYTQCSKT